MGSKIVALITILLVLLVAVADWHYHGHGSDEWHRQAILNELKDEPGITTLVGPYDANRVLAESPSVKVKDRIAHVSGLVDSPREQVLATAATLRIPGLLTVYNDVRVDAIDEPLLKALDDQLAASPTPGAFEYRIDPDGHTVTLNGWVPKGEEDLKQAIEDQVRRIPGVRKVINNMTVGPPVDSEFTRDILTILQDRTIYFDYNKATIRQESMKYLERIAALLNDKYKDVRVRVEGHTDSIASESYNQRLSEARSESVKAALVQFGVDAGRIETMGYGESRPIAPNNTPEGRSDNRRIEFVPITQ